MRTALAVSMCLVAVQLTSCKHDSPKAAPAAEASPPARAEASAPSAPPDSAADNFPLPQIPALPGNPAFLPEVTAPAQNPLTAEKAYLGKLLFFDPHLSKSGQLSCEGCHYADKGWAVDKALSPKDDGTVNKRNAPSLLNIAFHTEFYWDGRMPTLEAVSLAAWKGQLAADPPTVVATLNQSPAYRALFKKAFNEKATPENVAAALASFFRTLKSGDSAWDRFEQGEANAVSKQAKRGFEVFKNAGCALCHAPPLYTDSMFHNVGIGMDKPEKDRDAGRMAHTKAAADLGKFKTPSLRDVALTAPYFHDGSAATLDQAIDTMLAGGKANPQLDEKLKPVKLPAKDRAALKAFLESLNGKHTFTPVDWVPPIP